MHRSTVLEDILMIAYFLGWIYAIIFTTGLFSSSILSWIAGIVTFFLGLWLFADLDGRCIIRHMQKYR